MPTRRTMDYHAATELDMYIQNSEKIYRMKGPFVLNIARKIKSGKYKHNLAWKLWLYLVDRAAAAYVKEFSGGQQSEVKHIFPKPVRVHAARLIAQYEREAILAGVYGELSNIKHWRL